MAPCAACCVLAFTIPLPFIFSTISIWLLALCWLTGGEFRTTMRVFLQTKAYWLWTIYFLLHAASYFWSVDKGQSEFDTVSKLAFILLPLLAGAGTRLDLRRGGLVMIAFIAGVAFTGLMCLDGANTSWQEDGNINHFFYHGLASGIDANAVYFAWYDVGALAALLLYPWRAAGYEKMLWWRWPVLFFLSGLLLLLASRLMMLSFVLIVIPAFGLRFYKRSRRFKLLIPALALLVGGITLTALARTNNPLHRRFADIMHPDLSVVTRENFHGTKPPFTDLTLRLFVWHIAFENMTAHHLWLRGAGNGDVHTLQNNRIASHGIPGMQEDSKPRSDLYKVNLHNMYLQSLIVLGVGGAVIFLLIAFGPLFFLRKADASWFFGTFHIVSILFMMQESALQTQAGVIYYCFFSAIFWTGVKRGEKRPLSVSFKR